MPFIEHVRQGSVASTTGTQISRRTHRALTGIGEGMMVRCAVAAAEEVVASAKVQGIHNVSRDIMLSHSSLNGLRQTLSAGDPVLAGELHQVQQMSLFACGEILSGLTSTYLREGR